MKKRNEEARKVLKKLRGSKNGYTTSAEFEEMVIETEEPMTIRQLFADIKLRRPFYINLTLQILQQVRKTKKT